MKFALRRSNRKMLTFVISLLLGAIAGLIVAGCSVSSRSASPTQLGTASGGGGGSYPAMRLPPSAAATAIGEQERQLAAPLVKEKAVDELWVVAKPSAADAFAGEATDAPRAFARRMREQAQGQTQQINDPIPGSGQLMAKQANSKLVPVPLKHTKGLRVFGVESLTVDNRTT